MKKTFTNPEMKMAFESPEFRVYKFGSENVVIASGVSTVETASYSDLEGSNTGEKALMKSRAAKVTLAF